MYVGAAITLGALTLYIRTAARNIVVGDTPELMTAAATLGVAHPPGYPLLTLLGYGFSLLPLGSVAFRLNLMAVVCAAGVVALVYMTAYQLTRSRSAAAVSALALAMTPLVWSWSLVFEAFSLNNFLAAALIYLLVLWDARPKHAGLLFGAAFVGGLGCANHQTIVLLAPAALFLIWRHRGDLPSAFRVITGCAAAFVLGLLPYAYIPWAAARHPYLSWGDVASFSDLLALFLRTDYGTGRLVAAAQYQGGSPFARVAALAASFPPLVAVLALAGLVGAYRSARNYFWFAALAFLVAGPAFIAYANMDLSQDATPWVFARFFLLPHVVVAPLVAFGVLSVAAAVAGAMPAKRSSLIRPAVVGVALAVIVATALSTYRQVDQSRNDVAARYARDVLDTAAPGSLLLATGDEHGSPLAFVQAVERRRPDVTLLLAPLLKAGWYLRLMTARYPELKFPRDKEPSRITLKDIVDANRQRRIALAGPSIDNSVDGSYGYIRHGLLSNVEPVTRSFDLAAVAADNDVLLRKYQPPSPATIKRGTFEPQLLRSYAAAAEWVGTRYKQAGRATEAVSWYQRALQVDPDFEKARNNLDEIARE